MDKTKNIKEENEAEGEDHDHDHRHQGGEEAEEND